MNQKRTVVVAGTVSALLLGASAAFAVGSGLFAAGAADKVGSFQAIEQAAASRRPASIAPSSTTRAAHPTSTLAAGAHESGQTGASAPDMTPSTSTATTPETASNGFEPPQTTAGSEGHETTTTEASPPTINRPTTSTSAPEHEVEPPDSGSGSDD